MITSRTRVAIWVIRSITAIFIIGVLFFPLYWAGVTAFTPTGDLLVPWLNLFPPGANPTLDGFEAVLAKPLTPRWFLNSVIVTLGSSSVSMVISVLAGYALSRFSSRAHRTLGISLLISRMLPGSLLVIPIYVLFVRSGLVNNLLSLIIVNTAFIIPFTTWMLKAFFDQIPTELEEAAMVDGSSRFGALVRIILPLSRSGLGAAFTYSVLLAWGDFLFARTLLTDQEMWPVTVGVASFLGQYSTDWNGIMAVGLMACLPMLALFILTERALVSGITAGAVKG